MAKRKRESVFVLELPTASLVMPDRGISRLTGDGRTRGGKARKKLMEAFTTIDEIALTYGTDVRRLLPINTPEDLK